MFLLCRETLKKSPKSTSELGVLRDIVGRASSPRVKLELEKKQRSLGQYVLPQGNKHLGNRKKKSIGKTTSLPFGGSSS